MLYRLSSTPSWPGSAPGPVRFAGPHDLRTGRGWGLLEEVDTLLWSIGQDRLKICDVRDK